MLNHYCQWNRHCYQVRSWRACKMPWKASKQPIECCGSIKKQDPAFPLSWWWGEGCIFLGQNDWWMVDWWGGCFICLNACNVRIYTLPNNEHFIRSWSGYLRFAMSWDAGWQPVIWCPIMFWGLFQTKFWKLKIWILHVNTEARKVDRIYLLCH